MSSDLSLSRLGILAFLSEADLEVLKAYGSFGGLEAGSVIVQQGTDQDQLYFICSGRLEVLLHADHHEMTLGVVQEGDCVGEMSVFECAPASATVRALEQSVVWHMGRAGLEQYMAEHQVQSGQLMLGITQLLARRLRRAGQHLISSKIMPNYLAVRLGTAHVPAEHEEERKKDYVLPSQIKV